MAIDTLDASIKATIAIISGRTFDFANPGQSIGETPSVSITTVGSGANSANQIWSDQRTLSASASENLDFSGSLTNCYGQTVAFTIIKFIYIRNRSTTGNMLIGASASNQWGTMFSGTSPALQIRQGGFFINCCTDATGWAVTAGGTTPTGDVLKVLNQDSGASLTYDIVLVGVE